MPYPKKDQFLKEVLSYIKFPFDREDIKLELEGHIVERIHDYIEQGYDPETAEQLAIEDMGDSTIIGTELNKEHNPIFGWLLHITNGMIIFLVLGVFFIFGVPFITSLFPTNLTNDISKDNIVYEIEIDEKVQLDDRIIRFTDVVYEKNGDMNIFYEYYSTTFRESGWSLGTIGQIRDDLDNEYFDGSGYSRGGRKNKSRRTVHNFSEEADMLIIDYDLYNRQYKVEIPLEVGGYSE